jgi:hypothetical protein
MWHYSNVDKRKIAVRLSLFAFRVNDISPGRDAEDTLMWQYLNIRINPEEEGLSLMSTVDGNRLILALFEYSINPSVRLLVSGTNGCLMMQRNF